MTSIDFHAHFVPPGCEQLELTTSDGSGTTGWCWDEATGDVRIGGRLRSIGHASDQPWMRQLSQGILSSAEARVEWMDAAGLDVQALSPPPYLGMYDAHRDDGWRAARRINEGIAEAAASWPSRLIGFCTVPLQDPALAARELEYCVSELGMGGAQVLTNVAGRDLDHVEFSAFWDAVAELDVPVFIHPHLPTDRARMRHHYLVNSVGNPYETALAVAHLIFGGVLDRNPSLRIVLAHNGGAIPAMWGRWRHTAKELPEGKVARADFDSYFKNLYLDTIAHDPATLAHSIRLAGPSHVVLGTDYPYDMGDMDPIGTVQALAQLDEVTRASVIDGSEVLAPRERERLANNAQ